MKKNKDKKNDEKITLNKILDGIIIKKDKNFIYFIPKSSKKKIKVSFAPEISFVEINLSKSRKLISQKNINYNNIKNQDNVSLIVGKNEKKDIVYVIRKIIINS